MRYFAGIDSGTQSTKVLIVDDDGRIAGRGSAACHLIEGLPPAHKEQHPFAWWAAIVQAFQQAISEAKISARSIAAIGVSGQQHGFVPIDARGEVIRPAKLWCDTSTSAQCDAIMRAIGGQEKYHALIGNSLPPGFTASKILWLKQNEKKNFGRLRHVLLPHDWINYLLTGEMCMEYGDASGTGLMDVRSREWSDEVCAAIDDKLRAMLPPLADSREACGRARGRMASELGLSEECIIASGGGDNMMGAIGTGNVAPGIVTVSLGTSGTIYACSDSPVVDPRGEIAAFCDSTGKWLPLACTMNVTVATELTRKLFSLTTQQLDSNAATVLAGCDGLLLIPYFEGERTPNVPDGTGVWFGMRSANATPAHFARAAMEGATLGLGYAFNRMRELGVTAKEIRLTGGGSKSSVWRSIIADVLNADVVCTNEAEGAALGAAIQAKWICDGSGDLQAITKEWVPLNEASRVRPDPARVNTYRALQQLHDALSLSLRGPFAQHHALITPSKRAQ